MILLKQSTAAIDRLGPFVDDTDFKTKETGLSIGQSDIQISKAGGAYAQTSESSPTTTHDSDGYYQVPYTATDTGTLGRMRVKLSVSGALDVWADYLVVPAAVFDAIVNGTGNGIRADAVAWIGTALSETSSGRQAGNIDTFFDNADAATAKTLDDVGGGGSGGLTALASGTAQSGTASTLVLAASSTFADDELNNNVVNLVGGTGAGQSRVITTNTNSDDTINVTPDFTTTPDNTTQYEIVQGSVSVAQIITTALTAIAAAVWDYATVSMTTASSIGKELVTKLGYIVSGGVFARFGRQQVDGVLTVTNGDSYLAADSNALEIVLPASTYGTLSGNWKVGCTLDKATSGVFSTRTGTLFDAGLETQKVSFDLDGTTTSALEVDTSTGNALSNSSRYGYIVHVKQDLGSSKCETKFTINMSVKAGASC